MYKYIYIYGLVYQVHIYIYIYIYIYQQPTTEHQRGAPAGDYHEKCSPRRAAVAATICPASDNNSKMR